MATIPSESVITTPLAPPLPAGVTLSAGDLTPPKAAERGNVWALLAGLRFFLATTVVFTHLMSLAPASWNWLAQYPWAALGGFYAVIGFFVISGYSIAASLERSTEGFYARRFWRLAPVYWCCFFYAQLPWWIAHSNTIAFPNGTPLGSMMIEHHGHLIYLMNALCLQGLTTVPGSGFGQSWSLSCEVVYYLAAPFLLRMPTRWVLGITGLSVFAYFWHGWNFSTPFAAEDHGWAMMSLAWAWTLGFLLYRHRSSERAWGLFVLAFLTLTCADPIDHSAYGPITCAIVAVTFSPLLQPVLAAQLTPRLRSALLWLGEISYPLYLSHFATILLLGLYINKPHQLKADGDYLFYAASVAAAIAIYYIVDLPSRKLASLLKGNRRALRPSPQPAANV